MKDTSSDIAFLKDRYKKARNQYKPRQISTLLIVDAPPDTIDRYFYFEDVKKQDSLFLEIMGVLYPEQKQQYLNAGRDTLLKTELLKAYQEDGYFLINLSELPCSLLDHPLERDVPLLIERVSKLITKKTPIILIKTAVYDSCYAPLQSAGYNVIKERIPFPGSGQQRVFRDKFRKAIAS